MRVSHLDGAKIRTPFDIVVTSDRPRTKKKNHHPPLQTKNAAHHSVPHTTSRQLQISCCASSYPSDSYVYNLTKLALDAFRKDASRSRPRIDPLPDLPSTLQLVYLVPKRPWRVQEDRPLSRPRFDHLTDRPSTLALIYLGPTRPWRVRRDRFLRRSRFDRLTDRSSH